MFHNNKNNYLCYVLSTYLYLGNPMFWWLFSIIYLLNPQTLNHLLLDHLFHNKLITHVQYSGQTFSVTVRSKLHSWQTRWRHL